MLSMDPDQGENEEVGEDPDAEAAAAAEPDSEPVVQADTDINALSSTVVDEGATWDFGRVVLIAAALALVIALAFALAKRSGL
jgi:hypothetical protein